MKPSISIMPVPLVPLVAFLGLAFLVGCTKAVYPIATGSHVPLTDEEWQKAKEGKRFRFIVWGNHPAMVNAAMALVQEGGHTVVERARLQELFDEQQIRLNHTADDEADILKLGRLLGADLVIFGETNLSTVNASFPGMGYHLSVSARAVKIENGEVRWSGTATYPQPINNPEFGIIVLTRTAIMRAICPLERGFRWVDLRRWGQSGCLPNN